MIVQSPNKDKFTIYSKDKCEYCIKVKILLEDANIQHDIIKCDTYLADNRDEFLDLIKGFIGKEWKTFPIVFNDKGEFVGGFKETEKYLEKILHFDEEF